MAVIQGAQEGHHIADLGVIQARLLTTPTIVGRFIAADLLGETPLTTEQRLFVGSIKSSATAALAIAHDILDYAKIKAHGLDLLAESFDLEQLIYDVTALMWPAARANNACK